MKPTPSGVHLALASYIPGDAHSDAHWPESGPVTRASTIDTLPPSHYARVLDVPVQDPRQLQFHGDARWVVLEIADADYASSGGIVDFRRGVVAFHGSTEDARRFLEERGFAGPCSLPTPHCVPDGGEGSVGEGGIILGASRVRIRAGDHAVAYAVAGGVLAGDYALAAVTFGGARAGNHGVAVALAEGSAQAGDHGLARCDEFGRAAVGRAGVALADTGSLAFAGDRGIAIGRHGGSANAGAHGVAMAWGVNMGGRGGATAGERGLALAEGPEGRVAAGEGGILILVVDGRAHVAHVGEHGILPGVAYGIGADGRWAPAAVEGGRDEPPTD